MLAQDFDADEMNVIVLEEVAKGNIDTDWKKLNVAVTDEVGEQTVQGLTRLLGGEQAIKLANMEDIYAAGELATVLARTASAQSAEGVGLKASLVDFNVPEGVAQVYRDGVEAGGVLFWLRTDDRRGAEATQILSLHHAKQVIGSPPV